jgi:Siphovirus ReqiPepy6 Gp37-like protein
MDAYTLDHGFLKKYTIDEFKSLIWTERYYGDSEVEMVVPATVEMYQKLPVGTFFSIDSSDEVMILESMNIEKNEMKLKGISLLPWMDNRFIRTSPKHEDQYWYIENQKPGQILWTILYNMCCQGSPYLNGTNPTGISNPQQFIIQGLGLKAYDTTLKKVVKLAVPYGPVYKAMKDIANTYEVGMQITLDAVSDSSYTLGFRSYRGLDRTTKQTDNAQVRFSPQMDSFTDIEELQSIQEFKTVAYAFATGLKPESGKPSLTTVPGVSSVSGQYSGFDLRASMVFASDITSDMVGGSQQKVVDMLNSRAFDEIVKNHFIKTVDGEIVPESQFKYGIHYNLGDIIEVEGNTGVVQPARITEYIKSQDETGEKAYPTVSIIE